MKKSNALLVGANVVDQLRARRPFGVEPAQLVAKRVRLREHAIGVASEIRRDRARASTGKRRTVDAVHDLRPGGQRVAPRDVVGRARRQHFDLYVPARCSAM